MNQWIFNAILTQGSRDCSFVPSVCSQLNDYRTTHNSDNYRPLRWFLSTREGLLPVARCMKVTAAPEDRPYEPPSFIESSPQSFAVTRGCRARARKMSRLRWIDELASNIPESNREPIAGCESFFRRTLDLEPASSRSQVRRMQRNDRDCLWQPSNANGP